MAGGDLCRFSALQSREMTTHTPQSQLSHTVISKKSISVKECMNDNMHITKVELRMEEAASNHR